MNWFTKKKVFTISFFGAFIFFISLFTDINIPVDVCYQNKFCGNVSELLSIYFLIFVPTFFLSLVLFKFRDSTFISWRNFSIVVIPILLCITSFFPTFTHGMDFLPVTKGVVIFLLTILYSIFSLILIFYKYFRK